MPHDPAQMDEAAVRDMQHDDLARHRAMTEPYLQELHGIYLEVFPGVWEPGRTDGELLAEHLPAGQAILDATTGCGITACLAGLAGCFGLALDINPAAVANANTNFARHDVPFQALVSNGLAALPDTARFDVIVANPPYLEGDIPDLVAHAFYGLRDFLDDLFAQGHHHLKNGGSMLITMAEWGPVDLYEALGAGHGWTYDRVAVRTSDDGRRAYRLDRWTYPSSEDTA